MAFRTTRDVHIDGKGYPPDKPISFTADQSALRDELLALGAIEGSGADAGAGKPLAKMTKDELRDQAAAEDVELPDGATNAMMIAAIEAKRAEAGS